MKKQQDLTQHGRPYFQCQHDGSFTCSGPLTWFQLAAFAMAEVPIAEESPPSAVGESHGMQAMGAAPALGDIVNVLDANTAASQSFSAEKARAPSAMPLDLEQDMELVGEASLTFSQIRLLRSDA